MANLRQQIAESEAVRLKFLSGKPFSEADFRNVLSPDADYKKQLDQAMRLVHDLVGHIGQLREERGATQQAMYLSRSYCPCCGQPIEEQP